MIFKCKNCGGNIVYNPDKGTMCCPHCESLDSEDRLISTEYMNNCSNCGAPMEDAIKQYTSSTKCPNCGTYVVLDERVDGDYRPDIILPFKVSKDKAIDLLKAEFGNRIFTPVGFLSRASIDKIEGMYVPFFMYDYGTHTDYKGTGTTVRTWRSGSYEYTETSYYDIVREMNADFDMIPVDASIDMDDRCMDLMEPYNYEALKAFEEKYMSGFMGELYSQTETELEGRAVSKVDTATNNLLNQSINGYATVTPDYKHINHDKKKVRYALLPVWEYIFHYQGQDYKFFVNGQTGKIVGETPVAKDKVVIYGSTVFAIVTIIGMFIRLALSI